MTTSRAMRSDLPVPPGEYLLEVLHEKGMTQSELARRLGRPLQPINEIVHGKKAITAQTALQLERVLDVPAHIWTGLEAEYRIALARASAATPRATNVINAGVGTDPAPARKSTTFPRGTARHGSGGPPRQAGAARTARRT